jgi:hypothetical protein
MKSAWTLLTGVALIAITLATGAAHGRLIGRWGAQPDVVDGARLLERVPPQFGDWQKVGNDKLDPAAERVLQCHGNIVRVYENKRTGDRVSVAVLLGPAGPISVHTPEICYSSRDYQITQDRKLWTSAGTGQAADDTLWDLRLTANDVSLTPLRVLYGWTNGKTWQATERPRFAFGGSPYLYKLQLAGPAPVEEDTRDVCGEFLSAFLPVLRNHMIDR